MRLVLRSFAPSAELSVDADDKAARAAPVTLGIEHRHAAQLATLRRIASTLNHVGRGEEVSSLLVDSLVESFGASWAALFRCNPDGTLTRRSLRSVTDVEIPEYIVGEDAERLDSAIEPPVLQRLNETPVTGLSAADMLIPIDDVSGRLGWFAVGAPENGEPFDVHDAEFLALLSSVAAPRLAYADFTAAHQRQSLTDELTGFANRRAFDQRVEEELARSNRSGVPFCMLLVGLDHFHRHNEAYGADKGDSALRAVAAAVNRSIRASDTPYRFEGDKIAVLIANADSTGGRIAAERIRKNIESLATPDVGEPLTASIGVATLKLSAHTPLALASIALQKKADEALYRAKRTGRNITVVG